MAEEITRIRCGICGCVNEVTSEVDPGEGLECGWCAGVTTIHLVGPTGAASRHRGPFEGFQWPLWYGYVPPKAVALRDAWKARLRRSVDS